jgi:hypothetical protein
LHDDSPAAAGSVQQSICLEIRPRGSLRVSICIRRQAILDGRWVTLRYDGFMRTTTMATLLAGCLLQCACGDRPPASALSQKPVNSAASFDTSIDTRQLMSWMIEPSSKVVFGAVATNITEQGEENVQPRSDEEWHNVRKQAAIVLEAGNLLMLEGRARPSLVQDVEDWNTKARAMSAAARTAIEAIDLQDPEALFAASGDIYQTCTDCHAKYMYSATPSGEAPATL